MTNEFDPIDPCYTGDIMSETTSNPFEITYPEQARDIINRLEKGEPITFKEAEIACRYLTRIFRDVGELLHKSYKEMEAALYPVVMAAQHFQTIIEDQERDRRNDEQSTSSSREC